MTEKKDSFAALGIILGVFCAVASGILATTNFFTKEPIRAAKFENTNKALKTILPSFDNVPAQEEIKLIHNGKEVFFYPAKMNGQLVEIAAKTISPKGYGGNMTLMLSMTPDGKIGAVIVTQHNETPGLGSIVTDRITRKTIRNFFSGEKNVSGIPENKVLDSFRNKNAFSAPWKIKKDGGEIESITGATVSGRAVTDAVNSISETFADNRKNILKSFSDPKEKNQSAAEILKK